MRSDSAFSDPALGSAQSELEGTVALVAELARHPLARQKWLVRNQRRFQSHGLAEDLLDRSREQWHENPELAEGLAELGLEVVEQIDEEACGVARVNDLKARAWAYVANARRIRSDLRSVEGAFRAADFYLESGSGDPLERAAILSLKAAFRRDQRRFDEAVEVLREAADIYREAGEPQQEVLILVQQATVLQASDRQAEALEVLQQAIDDLDEERDARLYFYAHHNLAHCLKDMGLNDQAQDLLPRVWELARRLGGRNDLLRVEWLEGLVLAEAGQFDEAERMLRRVRDSFVEQGIGYDAARVSLDLAQLYLRTGRTAEAKKLGGELLPIFESRDVHREALATLLIFQQALLQETATVAAVKEIAEFFERARGNPAARYRRGGRAGDL